MTSYTLYVILETFVEVVLEVVLEVASILTVEFDIFSTKNKKKTMMFYLVVAIHRMIVRLVMMYKLKCWVIKKQYTQRIDMAEMRMLRWMSGVIMKD